MDNSRNISNIYSDLQGSGREEAPDRSFDEPSLYPVSLVAAEIGVMPLNELPKLA